MIALKLAMQINADSLTVYGVRTVQNKTISFHSVILYIGVMNSFHLIE